MVEILGERVRLRELVPDDLDVVAEYASDPDVCRYVSWGPLSRDDTERFISSAITAAEGRPRHWYELAVTLIDTGELVGHVGLDIGRRQQRTAEFGYTLRPSFWGRGLATEAATLLVDFAFGELGLHRVWASSDELNRASARVLEKVGLRLEGRQRDALFIRGRWRTSLLWGVLEDEWTSGATPRRDR